MGFYFVCELHVKTKKCGVLCFDFAVVVVSLFELLSLCKSQNEFDDSNTAGEAISCEL